MASEREGVKAVICHEEKAITETMEKHILRQYIKYSSHLKLVEEEANRNHLA